MLCYLIDRGEMLLHMFLLHMHAMLQSISCCFIFIYTAYTMLYTHAIYMPCYICMLKTYMLLCLHMFVLLHTAYYSYICYMPCYAMLLLVMSPYIPCFHMPCHISLPCHCLSHMPWLLMPLMLCHATCLKKVVPSRYAPAHLSVVPCPVLFCA